jgi:hypothetical protein
VHAADSHRRFRDSGKPAAYFDTDGACTFRGEVGFFAGSCSGPFAAGAFDAAEGVLACFCCAASAARFKAQRFFVAATIRFMPSSLMRRLVFGGCDLA